MKGMKVKVKMITKTPMKSEKASKIERFGSTTKKPMTVVKSQTKKVRVGKK